MPTITIDFDIDDTVAVETDDAIKLGTVKQIDVESQLNDEDEVTDSVKYFIIYDDDLTTMHQHDAANVYENLTEALIALYGISA